MAVAKSSAGVADDSMLLTWGCSETPETTATEITAAVAVTSVVASVSPPSYTGTCPVEFTMSAVITVNGPGIVIYQWQSECEEIGPPQTLTFASAGSQTVTKIIITSCGKPLTGFKQVRILAPNELVSNKADFTLTCLPDIEVMPTTVDFGEIECGDFATYGIIIKNASHGELDIIMANITSGGSFFSIIDDSCMENEIYYTEECTIGVKFGPLGVCSPSGTIYGGNLRIRSNDPDEGTVNVSLKATQS